MLTGLEQLQLNQIETADWGACALVCNQASVTKDFQPAWKVLQTVLGGRLRALFGPQHGFESTVQDNMIETGHGTHLGSGLPVYSLYSETREPTSEMLRDIETLVVDLQISGCRVYTYKYTLAACMRAAKKFNLKVVVLDRPNPLGGEFVEGNVLNMNVRSFVGEFEIPMRHGLTTAEAARFFNRQIGCHLQTIPLKDWNPKENWADSQRPWVLTSPNLPSFDAASVYCGGVLFEGVNISEGRGTCLPFQFFGSPFIRHGSAIAASVTKHIPDLQGVHLRPASFQPTSQKWSGQSCNGVHLIVLEPKKIPSYYLGLALIRAFIEVGEDQFAWAQPPYEYEFEKLPIDLIIGFQGAHEKMMADNFSLKDRCWHAGVDQYIEAAQDLLLYPRRMKSVAI